MTDLISETRRITAESVRHLLMPGIRDLAKANQPLVFEIYVASDDEIHLCVDNPYTRVCGRTPETRAEWEALIADPSKWHAAINEKWQRSLKIALPERNEGECAFHAYRQHVWLNGRCVVSGCGKMDAATEKDYLERANRLYNTMRRKRWLEANLKAKD